MKWRPGAPGSPCGGTPGCCAAALAPLDVVGRGLLPRAAPLGERFPAGAQRRQKKSPPIGEVRGRGLMIGVEFVKDRKTREPAPEIPHELVERAFKRGRSEEHTSELQSLAYLVCRLLLEKKKKKICNHNRYCKHTQYI